MQSRLAAFEIGAFRFLLHNFYVEAWAENFMMHLMVEDGDPWWAHIQALGLRDRYPGIMAKPPHRATRGPAGALLSDPTGVLWHIADDKQ